MNGAWLLIVHLVATWYMTGLIWFVQVVHYPLMSCVGADESQDYARRHQSLTSLVVGPPMLIEAATGVLLIVIHPEIGRSWLFEIGMGLLVVVWLSTAFWQVPIHRTLLKGRNDQEMTRLVRTNWLRTAAWSCRAVLVAKICAGQLTLRVD